MKHRFASVLIVCSLLVALVSIAAAPMASGNATLIGAGYVEGKGVVFTFHITGTVSKSDMKGGVSVDGGGNYGLDCVKVDSETVKCTASKAVAGNNVVVSWGGSTFWTYVPEIPVRDSQHCYDVYDWPEDEESTSWQKFGTHCQDAPAVYGDLITWENPSYGEWDYMFLPESPDQDWCPYDQFGDAYYYPSCGW